MEVRAAELFEHSEGVLDTGDIERVHDMRVATRRLRAALEIFAPCFPKKPFKATLREVKATADALGERRDRDVSIAAMEEIAAAISSSDRRGVEVLIERLRAEQEQANDDLAPFVSGERLGALRGRVAELVEAAGGATGAEARPS